MKDLVFYSQLIILLLNIVVFIHLIDHKNIDFKAVRVMVLITFTVGLLVTFGKVSWFSVLFSFSPALTLINTTADGNINRIIKKFRSYIGRDKQHLQGLQRRNKTLSE